MSNNAIWVVGYHAINGVLKTNPERALEFCVVENLRNPTQADMVTSVRAMGLPVHKLDKQKLSKRVGSEQHQGVALLCKPRKYGAEQDLVNLLHSKQESGEPALILVLDQIQDPHNFGACLRTADAAGVDAVVVAKDNASPMTPVVQKVASGAAETVAIFRVTNLVRCLKTIQDNGVWVVGTSDQAKQSLYQLDLSGSVALVMGAEGKGMRSLTMKTCDELVNLPMAGEVVSSLNVSVATGVVLFEAVRQRVKL